MRRGEGGRGWKGWKDILKISSSMDGRRRYKMNASESRIGQEWFQGISGYIRLTDHFKQDSNWTWR